MPFERILTYTHYTPWFCTSSAYLGMRDFIDVCVKRAEAGGSLDFKNEGLALNDLQSRREMTIDQNGIAHVHVLGVLGRGLAPIEKICGRTDYADLEKELALAQRNARAVAIDFDTPGGSAISVDQTAKAIAALTIPKVASSESLVASAGYYLAAGCDRIFLGSGSMAGSIGTIMPWKDTSQQALDMGVQTKVFVNKGATLKGIRNDVPLTEDQEAYLQEMVNALGSAFRSHIEDHRTPDESVYQAGTYVGQQAVDCGLVDEIGGRVEAVQYLLTRLRT